MAADKNILRIGNAQGFWGDSIDAPARLVAQAPDLDVLTLDYLAEVSMSILAKQREKDSSLGYARDFVEVVRSLATFWKSGRKLRLITNAGGLNPRSCAQTCATILRSADFNSFHPALGGQRAFRCVLRALACIILQFCVLPCFAPLPQNPARPQYRYE